MAKNDYNANLRLKKPKSRYFTKERNIFKWFWLVLKAIFKKGNLLMAKGVHLISGYMGSGKTLLASHLINEIDSTKYFFLSNLAEFNDVKSFDLADIFYDNEQNKSFPLYDERGRRLYAIILDEINLKFNKRLNKKADYNDMFIGLQSFLVTARHQGIDRIYFIGQKLELQDTQLISLFKYQHDIYKTKRFPYYWYYYENNYIEFVPRKLKMINRVKALDNSNEFVDISKSKVKICYSDLVNYNTKFLGNEYSKLPKIEI